MVRLGQLVARFRNLSSLRTNDSAVGSRDCLDSCNELGESKQTP